MIKVADDKSFLNRPLPISWITKKRLAWSVALTVFVLLIQHTATPYPIFYIWLYPFQAFERALALTSLPIYLGAFLLFHVVGFYILLYILGFLFSDRKLISKMEQDGSWNKSLPLWVSYCFNKKRLGWSIALTVLVLLLSALSYGQDYSFVNQLLRILVYPYEWLTANSLDQDELFYQLLFVVVEFYIVLSLLGLLKKLKR